MRRVLIAFMQASVCILSHPDIYGSNSVDKSTKEVCIVSQKGSSTDNHVI